MNSDLKAQLRELNITAAKVKGGFRPARPTSHSSPWLPLRCGVRWRTLQGAGLDSWSGNPLYHDKFPSLV